MLSDVHVLRFDKIKFIENYDLLINVCILSLGEPCQLVQSRTTIIR